MNEAEKRQFPRFKVTDLEGLVAHLDRHRKNEKLVTVGQGGCGFYGLAGPGELEPPRRVYTKFQFEDFSVEVQGTLIYARPLAISGKGVLFYGVEFIPAHRELMLPLLEKLEAHCKDGKVKIDAPSV